MLIVAKLLPASSAGAEVDFVTRQRELLLRIQNRIRYPGTICCVYSSIVDPDPDWIRIQDLIWIRIPNTDPDPHR